LIALAALITGLVALLALRDWRKALLAVLVIGVLQDVFRKMTPGVPSLYLVWSVGVYVLAVVMAFGTRAMSPISVLYLNNLRVRFWLQAFLAIVVLQMIHSLVRYGNPAIPILGGLFYLGPLVAMLTATAFVDTQQRLHQFMYTYLVIFVPVCLTVYLSAEYSSNFPVLRDIGTFTGQALVIFDVGTALYSNPGLLRVGEIAAWHASTCVVFLSILALTSRSTTVRVLNTVLSILLVGAIVLTGRRKMLVALSIFLALQWGLLIWHGWGMRRVGATALAIALTASLASLFWQPSENTASYLARSQSAYSSVDDRVGMTLNLARSAMYRSQGIGIGAGATSQGARYAGGVDSEAGGAAEAGLGKIIVELGIPGLVVLSMLILSVSAAIGRQIKFVGTLGLRLLIYDISFIAFLVSNLAAFAVASQLFGDFFVLIMIGTVAGFVVRIHGAALAVAQTRIEGLRKMTGSSAKAAGIGS
jgi:hypothetical protein